MEKKDTIFACPRERVAPFEFNETVVSVFDDMIHRSVPLYREIVTRQAQLAALHYREGTLVYDLGCSNGNLGLLLLGEMGDRPFSMVAVDNSAPMLGAYEERLSSIPGGRERIHLACKDIQDTEIENASVVIVNLTLQFLPVDLRDRLVRRIYRGLVPGGVLLFTEKVVHESETLSGLQQDFYYRFKKENGYSGLEISQKRDALENVLIPETVETHRERLMGAGFTEIDIWLKWFNFAAFICLKERGQ